jgi:hypothetical protein
LRAAFFAGALRAAVFLATAFPAGAFFAAVVFRAGAFFADAFLAAAFLAGAFFAGTFAPSLRASDNPIAIACLRLVTFLPEPPLLSVPALRSFIAASTLSPDFLPYVAMRVSVYWK